MSLKKIIGVASVATLFGVSMYGMGCSSATTIGNILDSGPTRDTSLPDNNVPSFDSGGDTGGGDSGASCSPLTLTNFTPVTITAMNNPVCTHDQIVKAVAECFNNATATNATCTAYLAVPANKTCLLSCMISPYLTKNGKGAAFSGNPVPPANGPWGSLIEVANPGVVGDFFNIGGCIQLADPAQADCGAKVNAQFQCEVSACGGNCPVPSVQGTPNAQQQAAITAAQNAFQSCVTAADAATCKPFADASTTCLNTFPDGGGAASLCLNGDLGSNDPTISDAAFIKLADLFCGGADGGTTPPSDSGAD